MHLCDAERERERLKDRVRECGSERAQRRERSADKRNTLAMFTPVGQVRP